VSVNEARLQALLARLVYDLAAAQSAPLVVIGDRLGLYRAMARSGPATPGELARQAGVDPGYVSEWLVNQAAAGYVTYDPATGRFELPAEHALALADESSAVFMAGAFQIATGLVRATDAVARAFRTGEGVSATAYGTELFEGMDRASGVRARAQLLVAWLPALDDVVARLQAGASVADVGCGQGAAILALATAFPRSRFVGFDVHPPFIERARRAAAAARRDGRVRFEVAAAHDFPGEAYDLVTCLDCLHELADPVAAARHVRSALKADGTWLVVEPFSSDRVEGNLGPLGRLVSSVSALYCLPAARSAGGGRSGAPRGESWVREVAAGGGFSCVRLLPDVAANLVFEIRP
jgi:SAM-dependent methyltransferase